jgi:hypothetical protein
MTRAITVDVYEVAATPTNPLAHIDTLESDTPRTWLDEPSTPGSHSIEIKVGHADEALLTDGRLVRFSIGGTPRWWGLIEPRSKVSADPQNREAGRVENVIGRDAIAILEQARVDPETGVGSFTFSDIRWLGWMSKYYDDTSWDNATELKRYDDVDPTKPWFMEPQDWRDPNGIWIGPANGDNPGAWDPVGVPPGSIYLRGDLTFAEEGEYVDDLTADDGFKLYRDSEAVLARQQAGMWAERQSTPATMLDAVIHQYAVELINFDRPVPETNVTALMYSVIKIEAGGAYGRVVGGGSAGTKMLAFPVTEPGLTPGHIMKILIDEAHTRGAILPLHYDFDATVDSDGTPWPKEINLAVQIGGRLLEVAQKLMAMRVAIFRIKPNSTTLTLQAFVTGTDLSGSVEAEYALNIGALAHDRAAPGENNLLVKGADNRWREIEDSAAVTAWGRREGALSAGSGGSDGSIDDQGTAYLNDHADPAEVIRSVRLEPVNAVPYVDFEVGDIITAPDFDGAPATYRVAGINVSEDEAGQPIYDLNLESA